MAVAGSISYDTRLDTRGFQKGLNSITNSAQSGATKVKNIIIGLGITKIISTGINAINNSLDGAIKRVDTLNNFPKVMSNLGIGSEEAKKSVDKLSDKLTGLPTTLNDAASAVQRFTSKNGDINKSTDLFLAVNNAILSGGQSIEIQASALEQLSQAYSKGKFEMEEWKSLQIAMPGQLKQIAKAMGYVSDSELYEALKDGTVSTDEFMNKILELNTKGVDGFASFEEQARSATGGIETSITNLKTSITRGVGNIIGAIDKSLSKTKFKSINNIIGNISKEFEFGLKLISDVIKGDVSLEEAVSIIIKRVMNAILILLEEINKNLPQFYSKGIDIIVSIANGISEKIPELIPQIIETIIQLFLSITDDENVQKITNVGAKIIYSLIDGILAAIPELLEHPDFIIKAFLNIISGGNLLIKQVGFNLIKSLILGLINYIPELINRLTEIKNRIINKFKETITHMPEIGKNIVKGIWNGIINTKDWLINKIKSFANSTVDSIKKFFGINSPSRVMRDKVGQWLPKGIAVGIDANTDSVKKAIDSMNDEMFSSMKEAVNLSTGEIRTNASVSSNYAYRNTIVINTKIDGNIDMDGQKVGHIVTPIVTRTIKNGGGI